MKKETVVKTQSKQNPSKRQTPTKEPKKPLTKAQKQKIVKTILIVFWVLIIGLLAIVIYMISTDKDAFLIAIPGLYDTKEYNTLTKDRNQITQENDTLKYRNNELSQLISAGTENDFEVLYERLDEYINNTLTIDENLSKIVEIDQNLISLKLPSNMLETLNSTYLADKAVYDSLQNHYELLYAKLDYFNLRRLEGRFDNCISGIDFSLSDLEISRQMINCTSLLDELATALLVAEETYMVKFVNIGQYVTISKETAVAYANFYEAVAQENYTQSQQYDQIYNEKEEQLRNLDITTVWFEYKVLVLDPFDE
ncbi:hypothetical protein JW962_03115 [Candidatus Dojkabacteria bacterium]|nr:hypothetical protein [Candidatus Dojkabacteria bacterium]